MNIEDLIIKGLSAAIEQLYGTSADVDVKIEKTKPIFEGDYTFVVFPLVRRSGKSPEATAQELGEVVVNNTPEISKFNVIKGFLNFSIAPSYWAEALLSFDAQSNIPRKNEKVMVEYSSPNTNKPLHLGHIRNILLGYSIAEIMNAGGYDVVKANLINDRGIHICKSMLAWQRFGNGENPQSSGLKGDHLVGKYYVVFENKLQEQTANEVAAALEGRWSCENENIQKRYQDAFEKLGQAKEEKQISKLKGDIKDLVRNQSELMQTCQEMLRQWEAKDSAVIELWSSMNGWVYEGFNHTYKRLGVDFDAMYYESNTYLLGKDIVQEGLEKGVFFQKADGSVWIDLSSDGLDEKLVQRGDGTSVYITQDMGTADLKFEEHGINRSVYVVGNEQDYHFKVLFLIMSKLGRSYAPGMYHVSYGMVDLPSGKMKSREGTVVDADDLLQEMYDTAKAKTEELGKTEGLSDEVLHELYHRLSLAALKFFILKVDPKKRMLFNPEESIDFQGDTGPFVMYTYARIKSILRNAQFEGCQIKTDLVLHATEMECIKVLNEFKTVLAGAAEEYNPAAICQYVLDLAKSYNKVYNEVSILKESNEDLRNMRLQLALQTSQILQRALRLIGVETVERM
jgi:arginyl-tRNA synthetase